MIDTTVYRENVNIRRVPADLWLRLKVEATRREVEMNEILAVALLEWLNANEGKN